MTSTPRSRAAEKLILINFRCTPEWRTYARKRATALGMNLSEYIRHLVAQDTILNSEEPEQ